MKIEQSATTTGHPADSAVGPPGSPFSPSQRREPEAAAQVQWRELAVVFFAVLLCDVTIYRGHGFAGYAALFLIAPLLIACGALRPRGGATWIIAGMLVLLAARMLWAGSGLLIAAGFSLLAAFGMALSGQTPHVAETLVFASQSIAAGYKGFVQYGRSAAASPLSRIPLFNVGLPLAALLVFGSVFVLANPDLLASFSDTMQNVVRQVREWLAHLSWGEVAFWVAVAWVATGLLRQISLSATTGEPAEDERSGSEAAEPSRLYPAFRNTLLTVIVLFAVYLVFEFRTLWFREFPKGFYYSGYAHEGAAWLTFALALATAILSLVFRGTVLHDPRLVYLRRLGWIWSAENFVLAVAVYHRMAIYINFNGMSPMRMVGLYGMSAVVIGFMLVLWKIGRGRSFGWLVRRQLWALAIVVYLFALTPVDTIVTDYNVRQILAGDPAASVQISVHLISAEGVLMLAPLLECDDAIIREGIAAMLAQRDDEAEVLAQRRESLGWTTYQRSDVVLLERLRAERTRWSAFRDEAHRDAALKRFNDYAYQWY